MVIVLSIFAPFIKIFLALYHTFLKKAEIYNYFLKNSSIFQKFFYKHKFYKMRQNLRKKGERNDEKAE